MAPCLELKPSAVHAPSEAAKPKRPAERYLVGKRDKERYGEVGLAERPVAMLHLGHHRRSHVELDVGLVLAADVVKQPLQQQHEGCIAREKTI